MSKIENNETSVDDDKAVGDSHLVNTEEKIEAETENISNGTSNDAIKEELEESKADDVKEEIIEKPVCELKEDGEKKDEDISLIVHVDDTQNDLDNDLLETSIGTKDGKLQNKSSEKKGPVHDLKNSKNLWVSGLSMNTKASDLKNLFSSQGKVSGAKVVTNAKTPGSKCYGFVTMSTALEAGKCVEHLNKTELHGRIISIEKAKGGPTNKTSENQSQSRSRDRHSPRTSRTSRYAREASRTSTKANAKAASDKKQDSKVNADSGVKSSAKKAETEPGELKADTKDTIDSKDKTLGDDNISSVSSNQINKSEASKSDSKDRADKKGDKNILSFEKIKEEREKERLYQKQKRRLMEEEERHARMIRREKQKAYEIEMQQRAEAMHIQREREALKMERMRLEREKMEAERIARDRMREERDRRLRMDRELQEERRKLEQLKAEEVRRAAIRRQEEERRAEERRVEERRAEERRLEQRRQEERAAGERRQQERRQEDRRPVKRAYEARANSRDDYWETKRSNPPERTFDATNSRYERRVETVDKRESRNFERTANDRVRYDERRDAGQQERRSFENRDRHARASPTTRRAAVDGIHRDRTFGNNVNKTDSWSGSKSDATWRGGQDNSRSTTGQQWTGNMSAQSSLRSSALPHAHSGLNSMRTNTLLSNSSNITGTNDFLSSAANILVGLGGNRTAVQEQRYDAYKSVPPNARRY